MKPVNRTVFIKKDPVEYKSLGLILNTEDVMSKRWMVVDASDDCSLKLKSGDVIVVSKDTETEALVERDIKAIKEHFIVAII